MSAGFGVGQISRWVCSMIDGCIGSVIDKLVIAGLADRQTQYLIK